MHSFNNKLHIVHSFNNKLYIVHSFNNKLHIVHSFNNKLHIVHSFNNKLHIVHSFNNKLHIVHCFLHLNCDSICNDLMIAFCDKQRLLFLLSTICVIIILKSLLDGFPHSKSNILLYHCFMSVQYFQPKASSIIFSYKNTQYIT